MRDGIVQFVPGSWKDFYSGKLNFLTLFDNEGSIQHLNLLLDPAQNLNAKYYGSGKFHENGAVTKLVDLWGARAQRNEAARCFFVYQINTDKPIGFANIGYSSKGLNLLEGGALFMYGTETALQIAALNAVYIDYISVLRTNPATEEKFKNTEGFIYTLWNDNPLLEAFEKSQLTSLASKDAEGMRKYLANNVNSRFISEDGYLKERIGEERIPILNGEEESQARRGFFAKFIENPRYKEAEKKDASFAR